MINAPNATDAATVRRAPDRVSSPTVSQGETADAISFERRALTLERSEETSRAASFLWSGGSLALAFRLLADDFARLLDAVRRDVPRDAMAPGLMAEVADLERVLGVIERPKVDREFAPYHAELFARIHRGRSACTEVLRIRRRWPRVSRRVLVALAVLAMLAILALRPIRQRVTASAEYSDEFPPENAVDGVLASEWLLPDGQTGWIELQFNRPRSFSSVRLRNARNRYFKDRGAHEFTVDAYSPGKTAASANAAFGPIDADSGWKELTFAMRDVTRVRVTISSFYGSGGGLAEIELR
ncbi:MAG: discoidin domain-containing protein [Myxococcota bacterium]|nr:discoidin domain-containing protein [Myxococcota bacterium]